MPNPDRNRWVYKAPAQLLLVGLLTGVSLMAFAQKPAKRKAVKTPFQGICGSVLFQSGNLMPGPGRPQSAGKPVVREVFIYESTNQNQTEASDEGFYQKVNTRLLKTVKSGKDGKFCISLPAGRYSVFVKEEKGLYANSFDAQNTIFPVTVPKNRRSNITIQISYQAAF